MQRKYIDELLIVINHIVMQFSNSNHNKFI